VAVKIKDIQTLLSKGGGIASSNTYKVTFEEDQRSANNVPNLVKRELQRTFPGFTFGDLAGDTIGGANPGNYISLMCDEVTLPGIQAATSQINGVYTGSGTYNYAHTRLYTDLTLSWICDANMTPMKFIQAWMNTIFEEYEGPNNVYKTIRQNGPSTVRKRVRNRSVRLNYMDEYTMQISILKAEKGRSSELGRPSIRYVCEGAFPYSIDSVPLSYGSTQLVKVSANFYYERWYPYYTEQWGREGPNIG
jgi:hypothetical protein